MSVSKFRKIYGDATPSGRFTVSEGWTGCGFVYPHQDLPAVWPLDWQEEPEELDG